MPVLIETAQSPHERQPGAATVTIGLLNNLADTALEGGERQFIDRLSAAAGSRLVRLRLFSLPEIARGVDAEARIKRAYTPFEDFFETRLDGLIVTGCEPKAAGLRDEPFWSRLAEIIDWAQDHTRSTMWSCLAAHAAVLHLDGVERRRRPEKISGIFEVERTGSHPLLSGAAETLRVPHSRYNDVAEDDLSAAGYTILTRSPTIGVDAFVKQSRSLFVFLQGHPEYDAGALVREYRRDILRFLHGTSETYPPIPAGIFDREAETALRTFASRAHRERRPDLLDGWPFHADRGGAELWRDDFAARLFTNWLGALRAKTTEHAA